MSAGSKPQLTDLSAEYDRWHRHVSAEPDDLDERSPWYRLVLEYLGPLEGKRALEVACGRGGFAAVLESRGATVFGADFSAGALQIARQKTVRNDGRSSKIAFSQADAHHLPFASDSFDCVISCETIEHLTNPLVAVGEMARVCKSGGLLYLTTPNYLNLMGLYLVYDALLKKDRKSPQAQPLDHRWLFPNVRRIIRRAGWEILKSDGTVHQVPVRGRNPVRLQSLESNKAMRRLLSPVAFHYFVLGRKRSR